MHRLLDSAIIHNRKAPRVGRLCTGCGGHLLTPRTAGRVSVGSRMPCLGPGREGREITSGRRDARGLTFSAVIQTRVMQPGGSTRGEQKWCIALCGYGLTFTQRQRVHWSGFIQSHLRRRTGSDRPGRTLLEGEGRVGYRASPQVQSTPSGPWWRLADGPVPVPPDPQSAQRFTGFPIAIAVEVGVAFPQQLLGPGVGPDLLAAVPLPAGSGAIGNGG